MATIRKFCCNDLLRFASVNIEYLTITEEISSYLTWFATWSDYCHVAVAPGNRIIGYFLGAAGEPSEGEQWQGLAITLSVASEYRRQRLATKLMRLFEKQLVEKMLLFPRDREYFVCLYVGVDNEPAIAMFEQLGYEVIKITPDLNSFKMRKELAEDREVFQFYG